MNRVLVTEGGSPAGKRLGGQLIGVHLDYKQEIKGYWYPYARYNKVSSS